MDKELVKSFQLINNRFNNTDERFNQLCEKIDSHMNKTQSFKDENRIKIISALIGSPVVTVLTVLAFTGSISL